MPEPKFEIYQDAAKKFRFRLRAANNEIVAVSEAYESKDACKNGIQTVKEIAMKALIHDHTPTRKCKACGKELKKDEEVERTIGGESGVFCNTCVDRLTGTTRADA